MERDFERKGAVLIKTQFGVVSATVDNFSLSPEEMIENRTWLKTVKAETGVFCLAPWELTLPF